MKIYFACSVRGGRQDQELYAQLIKIISGYGKVLTEHLGEKTMDKVDRGLDDKTLYREAINWVTEADVLIAEVTTASLGVGYEIATAERLGKKILCIYQPDKNVSAMITGNPSYPTKSYATIEEAQKIIDAFFKS
jgi:2'-deoxynucleoside 5'-phosphate N-hydrolase